MTVDWEAIVPVVNSLVVMGFVAIFGYIYLRSDNQLVDDAVIENEIVDETADNDDNQTKQGDKDQTAKNETWNFDTDLSKHEEITFKEIGQKVNSSSSKVIAEVDETLKQIEYLIQNQVITEEFIPKENTK